VVHDYDVKWPCYFHADWPEIAPLLLGNPTSVAFDRPSQPWLEILKRDVTTYAGSHAPFGVEAAKSEGCARAVGYATAGGKTTYLTDGSQSALLYGNSRGGRYKAWVEGLNTYTNSGGSLFVPAESKWKFVTYGGGGAGEGVGFLGGDIVVKSPEGVQVCLAYGGLGPAVSTPKFGKIPKSRGSGGPNSFETHGNAYIFGSSGEPTVNDLSGFCLIFSGSAAVGAGLLSDGAGLGQDVTVLLILGMPKPVIAFPMRGHTAGLNAGAGIYFGYVHPL